MCDYIGFYHLKCSKFKLMSLQLISLYEYGVVVRLMDGGRLVETPML